MFCIFSGMSTNCERTDEIQHREHRPYAGLRINHVAFENGLRFVFRSITECNLPCSRPAVSPIRSFILSIRHVHRSRCCLCMHPFAVSRRIAKWTIYSRIGYAVIGCGILMIAHQIDGLFARCSQYLMIMMTDCHSR